MAESGDSSTVDVRESSRAIFEERWGAIAEVTDRFRFSGVAAGAIRLMSGSAISVSEMGERAVENDSIADQKMLRCLLPKSQDKLELGQWGVGSGRISEQMLTVMQ
jgi:hypothetical protein